jgi:hypothetical protein
MTLYGIYNQIVFTDRFEAVLQPARLKQRGPVGWAQVLIRTSMCSAKNECESSEHGRVRKGLALPA